jgi:acetyl-CoA carboxylase alpha subunit
MAEKKLKRTGLSSFALGAVALLACELPIILAAIGFGGLSAGAMALRPSQSVEIIAVALVAIGGLLLLLHFVRKRKSRE